jgi:hypothetical protein
MFDLETAAKRLHGTAAVDFHCQECLLPVRVIFSHDLSGDRGEWWEVKAVLEYESEGKTSHSGGEHC